MVKLFKGRSERLNLACFRLELGCSLSYVSSLFSSNYLQIRFLFGLISFAQVGWVRIFIGSMSSKESSLLSTRLPLDPRFRLRLERCHPLKNFVHYHPIPPITRTLSSVHDGSSENSSIKQSIRSIEANIFFRIARTCPVS